MRISPSLHDHVIFESDTWRRSKHVNTDDNTLRVCLERRPCIERLDLGSKRLIGDFGPTRIGGVLIWGYTACSTSSGVLSQELARTRSPGSSQTNRDVLSYTRTSFGMYTCSGSSWAKKTLALSTYRQRRRTRSQLDQRGKKQMIYRHTYLPLPSARGPH